MKKLYKIVFLIILLYTTSCSKIFDITPPTEVKAEELFSKEVGFYQALTGIYIKMTDASLYGRTLSYAFIDVIANTYVVSQYSYLYNLQSYEYEEYSAQTTLSQIWSLSYSIIANCNSILENMEGKEELFSKEYSSNYELLKGEVLAIRAFIHFNLLRLFGPLPSLGSDQMAIPYVTKISRTAFPKIKFGEFMTKVIEDMTTARELLLKNDPLFTGGASDASIMLSYSDNGFRNVTTRNTRMNYYAVTALLARSYLYKNDKVNAYKYAKIATDNTFSNYTNISSYHWLDGIYSKLSLNNNENNNNTLSHFSDGASNWKLDIPQNERSILYEADIYQTVDVRNFKNFDTRDGGSGIFLNKYNNTSTCCVIVRRSEMDLILAETASENGDDPLIYINRLRNTRGLGNYPLNSSSNLEEEITKEYRKEFVGEGQLFFYYKRKGYTSFKGINGRELKEMGKLQYEIPIPSIENIYSF
jgi:hypothetical protein